MLWIFSAYVVSGEEPIYGFDQCYVDFPCVFPTVELELDGDGLCFVADEIRAGLGHEPLYGAELMDGWYNFYVNLNGYTGTHIDNCITFTVNADGMDDDGEEYQIPINEEEQEILYSILNRTCKKFFGKDCEELLEDAALSCMDEAGGKLTILERST